MARVFLEEEDLLVAAEARGVLAVGGVVPKTVEGEEVGLVDVATRGICEVVLGVADVWGCWTQRLPAQLKPTGQHFPPQLGSCALRSVVWI